MLGLRLIEKRQRTAAAPSDQYHPFVFPHFFGVPDIRPKIDDDLFHDERRVVLGIAACRTENMETKFRKPSRDRRSEEHTTELQSLMRISLAVFCLQKKSTIISSAIGTKVCVKQPIL